MPTKNRKQRRWTAGELALLGKVSDSEVGRRTGRKKLTVQKQRQRLWIPSIIAKK